MDRIKMVEEPFMEGDKLPILPGIAARILEVVRDKSSNLSEIADILSSDPPLSAEVLKTVNSPLFFLSSKISSVHRAVSLLGIDVVKNIALSFFSHSCRRAGAEGHFSIFTRTDKVI